MDLDSLMCRLQAIRQMHGNLPVTLSDNCDSYYPATVKATVTTINHTTDYYQKSDKVIHMGVYFATTDTK